MPKLLAPLDANSLKVINLDAPTASATRDDTMQEARIGFFKAIQSYKPDGGTTFA